MTYWVLTGIVVMAAGFALRANPLLVVVGAALATGLAAGMGPLGVLAAFGKAFNDTRYVGAVYVVLPVIALLERGGLKERARALIARLRGATLGRILIAYLLIRQLTAALGLTGVTGQVQTVRPLIAPMAEAAAREALGAEPDDTARDRIKAMAAATDNVGLFFGEDVFIAIGSILLMKGFLEQQGIVLTPFELSVWAIPTAVFAFAIHGFRLWRFGRRESAR